MPPKHEPDMAAARRLAEIKRYQNDPALFAEEALGIHLWDKQAEIARTVAANKFTAVRSSNAVGKTYLAAALAVWFLRTHPPSYVITTGSSWKSIVKTMWPAIRGMRKNAEMKSIQRWGTMAPKSPEWFIDHGFEMFALSVDKEENFAGFRPEGGGWVFVIIDEASSLDDTVWSAINGLCAHERSKIFMIGNPLRSTGPFYDVFKDASFKTFAISAYDSPNITCGETVIPGLATQEWIDERRVSWGESSPMFQSRVMGNFPSKSGNVVMSLQDIESAQARWTIRKPDSTRRTRRRIGVDVARFGDDATVIQRVEDNHAYEPIVLRKHDLMNVVGHVVQAINDFQPDIVNVDSTGMGAGVVDRLREIGYKNICEIDAGSSPRDNAAFRDHEGKAKKLERSYENLRAQLWFTLADWLRDGGAIPPNTKLAGELSGVEYTFNSRGNILIEPKTKTKKRLGQSPDNADALCLAVFEEDPNRWWAS